MDVDELVERYPAVFHMAAAGSWRKIRRDGLLSTSALLDRYQVTGEQRRKLEACRRSRSKTIEHPETGETAVLRDNRPINHAVLQDLLLPGTSPGEWYRLLNRHVFFWVSESSLMNFLRVYANSPHDVITVSTRLLVGRDYERLAITPMNTGSARFLNEMERGREIFSRRIHEFDLEYWDRKTSPKRDTIVELAAGYAVESIQDVATRVERRSPSQVLKVLWDGFDGA